MLMSPSHHCYRALVASKFIIELIMGPNHTKFNSVLPWHHNAHAKCEADKIKGSQDMDPHIE